MKKRISKLSLWVTLLALITFMGCGGAGNPGQENGKTESQSEVSAVSGQGMSDEISTPVGISLDETSEETQSMEEPQTEEPQSAEKSQTEESQSAEEPQTEESQSAEEPQTEEPQSAEKSQTEESQSAEEPQTEEPQSAEAPPVESASSEEVSEVPQPAQEPESIPAQAAIDEGGTYTSCGDVALYLETYGKLPGNFITKNEAKALGWEGGSLEPYAPGKCIGGDRFGNYEGKLPAADGRTYHECDIDTLGAKSRGAKRIVYSSDGLIYYTEDHYESFTLLYD